MMCQNVFSIKGKWRKGTKSLPLYKCWFLFSLFIVYYLFFFFKRFVTLFYIMFHSGLWFILHNVNYHALILFKFCTWDIPFHSMFVFSHLLPFCCRLTQRVDQKSSVDIADIRFDSTTCAWDETLNFLLLCTYTVCIQMT